MIRAKSQPAGNMSYMPTDKYLFPSEGPKRKRSMGCRQHVSRSNDIGHRDVVCRRPK